MSSALRAPLGERRTATTMEVDGAPHAEAHDEGTS
jgi:hypothetical protein